MVKGILQAALTSAQRRQGFRLVELGDHALELLLKDSHIALFSKYKATVLEIRAEAKRASKQINK